MEITQASFTLAYCEFHKRRRLAEDPLTEWDILHENRVVDCRGNCHDCQRGVSCCREIDEDPEPALREDDAPKAQIESGTPNDFIWRDSTPEQP